MHRVFALIALTIAATPFYLMLPSGASTAATTPTGFAVIELFTSEGCSSCPPADRAVAAVAAAAEAKGQPVIALAWHVDYWDSLGWPDPFASAAHTQRQSDYLAPLGLRRLYTPQAVINGQVDVVGSRQSAVERAVRGALAGQSTTRVEAHVTRTGDAISVRPVVEGARSDALIVVAVTQSGLKVKVPRGENAGRHLAHDHVVRAFAEGRSGEAVNLKLPAGVDPTTSRVVVLVHDRTTRAIVAATSRPLS